MRAPFLVIPHDDDVIDTVTEAFDDAILEGSKPPLPASLATFTPEQVRTFPHLGPKACAVIGVLPTDFRTQADYQAGTPIDPAPADFNPRPTQSPGTPTAGDWVP